ncbi:Magnesium transporter [Plasmodiophora brassicae]
MEVELVAGIGMSIIASVLCNAGFLLQKLAHGQQHEHRYWNRTWVAGLLVLGLGSVTDYIALAMIPQSVVAPLGAVTLLSNLALSPIILGEKVTSACYRATAVIIIGNVLAVLFSSYRNAHVSAVHIITRAQRPDMIVNVVVFVALLAYLKRRELAMITMASRSSSPRAQYSAEHRQLISSVLAGILGAANMLLARVLSLMMRDAIVHSHVSSMTAMIVSGALMAATLFGQIRQMNDCLEKFEATYVIPISQSAMCIGSVTLGFVFFEEYRGISILHAILFAVGVAVTVRGQLLLIHGNVAKHTADEATLETVALTS